MSIVNINEGTKIRFVPDKESGDQLIPWTIADSPEPVHWHHSLEICCCVSGKGTFYCTEHQYEIIAGDIIIVNNVERHTSQSRGEPCNVLCLFFDVTALEDVDFAPIHIRP